jgi:hypothetical protein
MVASSKNLALEEASHDIIDVIRNYSTATRFIPAELRSALIETLQSGRHDIQRVVIFCWLTYGTTQVIGVSLSIVSHNSNSSSNHSLRMLL